LANRGVRSPRPSKSRELRHLQLAGLGSTLAIWAYSIAIAVYAYRADGPKAVGIVLFVRWSLAAVAAPVAPPPPPPRPPPASIRASRTGA